LLPFAFVVWVRGLLIKQHLSHHSLLPRYSNLCGSWGSKTRATCWPWPRVHAPMHMRKVILQDLGIMVRKLNLAPPLRTCTM
jgi:hypothetical protein